MSDVAVTSLPAAQLKPARELRDVVQFVLFVVLLLLIAGPLLILLVTSIQPRSAAPLQWGAPTLEHYYDVALRPGTLQLLWNTLAYAGGCVIVAVLIATSIAFLTERTDMPGRTTVRVLMYSWMAVPAIVFGYGWILLINPGRGAVNVALQSLFGLTSAPLTPYSIGALIAIAGLSLVPTAYVMVSGLLRNMDPTLEDAAFVSGAGRTTILTRITAPLLAPGILSVGIFLIMAMVQSFDLPMIIGLTARIPVLSTRIYTAAAPDSGLPNYGLASAFGVCLLVLAMALMILYARITRASEKFRTVSGKGFRPRRVALSGAQRVAAFASVGIYFTIMLLPLLILFWASLFPFYRLPALSELGNASFDAYRSVLGQPQTVRALVNTALLFLSSATAVVVLACLVSWFAVRGGGRIGRLLDMMSFAPMAIPPVVMAIALLLVFLKTPLNGTLWVIVVGHMTIYLAFAARTMNAALLQIHKELEDAALVSGATWATSLRYILFPMVWPHIINTWLWVVAHSARDLTFPLLLMTSTNVVAATAIFLRWDFPDLPGAAALSMIVVIGLMALVIPIQIYVTRRIDGANS
jgi:iron(III) transport system permease protein